MIFILTCAWALPVFAEYATICKIFSMVTYFWWLLVWINLPHYMSSTRHYLQQSEVTCSIAYTIIAVIKASVFHWHLSAAIAWRLKILRSWKNACTQCFLSFSEKQHQFLSILLLIPDVTVGNVNLTLTSLDYAQCLTVSIKLNWLTIIHKTYGDTKRQLQASQPCTHNYYHTEVRSDVLL